MNVVCAFPVRKSCLWGAAGLISMRRTALLVTAFAIAHLLIACGSGLSYRQRAEAGEAIKALQKITTASLIGVDYGQYRQLVIDAQAQTAESLATLPDDELRREITAAISAYVDADEAWREQFRTDPHTGTSGFLREDTEPGQTLIPKYSLKTENRIGVESGKSVHLIWAKARAHLDRASSLLQK